MGRTDEEFVDRAVAALRLAYSLSGARQPVEYSHHTGAGGL